ncbi:CPCC family cysteine-rich protein [Streptomyces sp. NPDC059218]|uniref:CPCC family cysteine-rich protein n=1 Tax=unclassified Streptomyces TaxID=2593676 RepID=UPI0036C39E4D
MTPSELREACPSGEGPYACPCCKLPTLDARVEWEICHECGWEDDMLAHWLLTSQHFQRMELRAATENTASQAVALKAGFHREGNLRNAGFVHGARVDLVLFSLLPNDLGSSTDPTRHR